MRFETSQSMKLGQQMKLAPRMIQSMEILQMSLAELEERIEQELSSNPTLEQADPGGDGAEAPAESPAPAGSPAPVTIEDAKRVHVMGKIREAMVEMRRHVEKNADYVGPKFADEARKIHHGETRERSIYGEATDAESEALRDEGIEFGRIPWVPKTDA